jgi:hypothetical protein
MNEVSISWVLDCQKPWADLLVTGKKVIETRGYALPKFMVDKPVLIMETHRGSHFFDKFVGVVVFSGSSAYESEEAWRKDHSLHMVDPKSKAFGWRDDVLKFKWIVKSCARVSLDKPVAFGLMERHYRSIYRLKKPMYVRVSKPISLSQL